MDSMISKCIPNTAVNNFEFEARLKSVSFVTATVLFMKHGLCYIGKIKNYVTEELRNLKMRHYFSRTVTGEPVLILLTPRPEANEFVSHFSKRIFSQPMVIESDIYLYYKFT